MLDIAFFELMRRGKQNLLMRNLRFRINQRHHILQLVAETDRSADATNAGHRLL